jgi:hypothetical protein
LEGSGVEERIDFNALRKELETGPDASVLSQKTFQDEIHVSLGESNNNAVCLLIAYILAITISKERWKAFIRKYTDY